MILLSQDSLITKGFLSCERNMLAERKRYATTAREQPLYRPSNDEIRDFASAAGLVACYLSKNLTHFRGRRTALFSRASDATADDQR